MDKKGFSNIFFVFLFVIAFVFYIAPIYLKLGSEPVADGIIGESALDLINSYDTVNDFKSYLDKSVELASCQALYDQGKNGGYLDNKCGEEKGYVKWDTNCNPLASLEEDYGEYFSRELEKHIDFKPNYAYSFGNGNFLGKTENKVEKTYGDVKYYIDPSFSTKLKLDLNIYKEINSKIASNFQCLRDKNPKECIKDDNFVMEKQDKLIFFDVKTGVKCVVREGNEFNEKEIKIKFFKDFPKKELLNIEPPNLLK